MVQQPGKNPETFFPIFRSLGFTGHEMVRFFRSFHHFWFLTVEFVDTLSCAKTHGCDSRPCWRQMTAMQCPKFWYNSVHFNFYSWILFMIGYRKREWPESWIEHQRFALCWITWFFAKFVPVTHWPIQPIQVKLIFIWNTTDFKNDLPWICFLACLKKTIFHMQFFIFWPQLMLPYFTWGHLWMICWTHLIATSELRASRNSAMSSRSFEARIIREIFAVCDVLWSFI